MPLRSLISAAVSGPASNIKRLEHKDKMKSLVKITGFTAILIIITVILGFFFDGGIWYTRGFISERDARLAGFEAEQPGQIDVICVGNSLGICGVDPMYLYKNYGITSYNIGCEMQMPVETYYAIQRAIKDQPVKVVLWEANNISKHHMNLDAYISGLAEAIRYRSAYIKYHYIWKNIADGYIQRKYFKGFCVNEIVKPYTGGDYYDYSDPHVDVFAREQYYYFRKIKELCDDNGIVLILYGVPSPVSYNIRMHKGIEKLAEENGVAFLDGNSDTDNLHIDWEKDTFDEGDHLNLFGSAKMTDYLAQYMISNCDLPDHRDDPAFRSWDELIPAYEQEIKDMEGTGYPEIEKRRKKEK